MRVVFDLDGTLIGGADADVACWTVAARAVLGVDDVSVDLASVPVVTDLGVLDAVARLHVGRAVTDDEVERFRARYPVVLGDVVRDHPRSFAPIAGALVLLEALGERWGIATGNIRRAYEIKRVAAGLPAARTAMCAEDARDRPGLVAGCAERLGAEGRVVSVGDGVWDVDAARILGVPFVGVGTGERAARLYARGARHVVGDFADLDGTLALLERAEVPR
ncbi:MAG: HAD family hydrolase [Myxococcota bacterium]